MSSLNGGTPKFGRRKRSYNLPTLDDFQQSADAKTKNAEDKKKRIKFINLFRYATPCEGCFIIFSIILACIGSLGVPYAVIIYGEFSSLLVDRTSGIGTSSPTFILHLFGGGKRLTDATQEENKQAMKDDSVAYGLGSLAGAIVELALIALAVDILNRVALNQISRIRREFLQTVLRQDMTWYDTATGNNFGGRMTEDLDKLKEAIGEKIGIFSFLIMTFVTSIIASFIHGWKLTLVVLTCCPFIILSTALVAKIQSTLTVKELESYSGAGAVAEEVFSSIRTVMAFSGEKKESERFANLLKPAEETGRKKGLYSGLGLGAMWFIIYVCYAVAMWYGITLILADRDNPDRAYTPAVLVIVLFGVIMGAQNLGFSSPHIESFVTAKGAAQNIFSIIDRKSKIDPFNDEGKKLKNVEGNIHFKNLHFHYPARPDIQILKGLSLEIKAGQTVAFVGPSGCGKSTVLQLMQRFYDPLHGVVTLDGLDIKTANVAWLRSQIGVVGQEPVLFATSIYENIRYGRPSATRSEIEHVARMANCHDFIVKLPKGYKTQVGERGAQISGGQKQRIAIARALLRNPKILLLDEATSALDPTSEKHVQDALELASQGRTTLVVSHRLSTVTNADQIVYVQNGVVAEQGTHEELMASKGLYYQLVEITNRKAKTEQDDSTTRDNKPIQERSQQLSSSDNDDEDDTKNSSKEHDANSISSTKIEGKKSKKKDHTEEKYKISFLQLMKLNKPEWRLILVGSIAAMLHGCTFPVWAIFFGDFFGIMAYADSDYISSKSKFFSYIFLVIGFVAGAGILVQTYMFTLAGTKMTSRLRKTAFNTIIRQEVAYFDDEKNSVGALCARLAGDCSNVQGATGSRIGMMAQAAATIVVGMIISFIYSWELTLLTLVTIPFVCLSIYFEARLMESSAMAEKIAVEQASQIAVEAIANIRTVTSLGHERNVLERYCKEIEHVDAFCLKKLRFRGFVFGLGQSAPFFAYGLSMYYGGYFLISEGKLPYENMIKVSEALIFGSWMLGQALAYAPNVSAAIISAGRLMQLFERAPTMHNPQDKPYNTIEKSEGDITYENVSFEYPNRKGTPILRNLDLMIPKAKTIALVGPSGSGKSTCVQLLLRYYDPTGGSVNLSGIPTTEFSFDTLRSKMGLVSQEPVLFDRTIAENIAYGNNFRDDIAMTEIIEAGKKANIHTFVSTLPQGYDTRLGSKGAQLSGGQKQRIAIARALVRNPKILILDEATSALDMESEKVVQEALDKARSGRTCLTIAHRLITVRDADLICVLKKGVVVEQGTHDELMDLNGIYSELYMMQQVT